MVPLFFYLQDWSLGVFCWAWPILTSFFCFLVYVLFFLFGLKPLFFVKIIIIIENILTKIIKKELSKKQTKMRRTKLGADRSPHLLDLSMRKVEQIRKSNQFYPNQNTEYIQTNDNKKSR